MIAKRIELLSKIYDRDSESEVFIVKISIKQYKDIFNDLDPAPLRNRDINQALLNYLNECSIDIPLKYNISLQIIGPHEIQNEELETRVRVGLKTYFTFGILTFKREMAALYKKSLKYFFIFFALISFLFYLSSKLPSNISTETIIEGLSIGGWVFLWEAINIVVFKNREIKMMYKRYKRLESSQLDFVYE